MRPFKGLKSTTTSSSSPSGFSNARRRRRRRPDAASPEPVFRMRGHAPPRPPLSPTEGRPFINAAQNSASLHLMAPPSPPPPFFLGRSARALENDGGKGWAAGARGEGREGEREGGGKAHRTKSAPVGKDSWKAFGSPIFFLRSEKGGDGSFSPMHTPAR